MRNEHLQSTLRKYEFLEAEMLKRMEGESSEPSKHNLEESKKRREANKEEIDILKLQLSDEDISVSVDSSLEKVDRNGDGRLSWAEYLEAQDREQTVHQGWMQSLKFHLS